MIEQRLLKLRVSERGRTRTSLKARVLLGPCFSQCTVQLGHGGALTRGLQVSVTKGGVRGEGGGFVWRGVSRFCLFPFSDGGVGMDEKKKDVFLFLFYF